jgi:predicted nucleic acid-binding protein
MIYSRDQREPAKAATANAWLKALNAERSIVVSPQVLNELYAVSTWKFPEVSRNVLRAWVRAYIPLCIAPLDARVVDAALAIEEGHGFAWWDCVILASAKAAGCRYLLTEDMQHGRELDELTIVSPFLTNPAAILARP